MYMNDEKIYMTDILCKKNGHNTYAISLVNDAFGSCSTELKLPLNEGIRRS